MSATIGNTWTGPTTATSKVFATSGVFIAAIVWLAIISNPMDGMVDRSYEPIATSTASAETYRIAETRIGEPTNVPMVSSPANSASIESDYLTPRTADCGVAASAETGGYMSHWMRP